jgi:hypothetical protein
MCCTLTRTQVRTTSYYLLSNTSTRSSLQLINVAVPWSENDDNSYFVRGGYDMADARLFYVTEYN